MIGSRKNKKQLIDVVEISFIREEDYCHETTLRFLVSLKKTYPRMKKKITARFLVVGLMSSQISAKPWD
jgi:hypothetical protein